jgi:hypothetical protein
MGDNAQPESAIKNTKISLYGKHMDLGSFDIQRPKENG